MKICQLTWVSLVVMAVGTFAYAEGKDHRFEEAKKHAIHEMDLHLSAIQSAKSCFSSSMDHEGLKHCREELEKARMKIRAEGLDSKIHELQEEKNKLEK